MKLWRDLPGEMNTFLDDVAAEGLLRGRLAPDDAPPGYSQVVHLLTALAELEPIQPSKERTTVDSMASAIAAIPASPDFTAEPPAKTLAKVKSRISRARLVGAIAVAGVLGTTGLAYAGVLPGPAQNFASQMFAKIGLSVPTGHGKGGAISDIAHNNKGTGGGQVVCTAASDGNCQAGQHGHQGRHGAQTSLGNPGGNNGSGNGTGQGSGNSGGGGSGDGGSGVGGDGNGGGNGRGTRTAMAARTSPKPNPGLNAGKV